MSNPFEVGDRVRRTGFTYHNRVVNGCEYVVAEVTGRHIRIEGDPGFWRAYNFEHVAEKAKTDEELAAEYRIAIANAREAGLELQKRGYLRQWKNPSHATPNWRDHARYGDTADETRFVKTVTTTKEL